MKQLFKKGGFSLSVETSTGAFYVLSPASVCYVYDSYSIREAKQVFCKLIPVEHCLKQLNDGTKDLSFGLKCDKCWIKR